jgi:2-oxoglutarate ferredoxin oxidoreductase subunit beta
MMKRLKADAVPVKAAAKMTPEQLEGKFLTGVLYHDTELPEYCEQYDALINKVQESA